MDGAAMEDHQFDIIKRNSENQEKKFWYSYQQHLRKSCQKQVSPTNVIIFIS